MQRLEELTEITLILSPRVYLVTRLSFDIYEVPTLDATQIRDTGTGKPDGETLLTRVRALTRNGKGSHISSFAAMTDSDGRGVISVERGKFSYPKNPEKEVSSDEKKPLSEKAEPTEVRYGTFLEFDPYFARELDRIDLRIDLEHHFSPPEIVTDENGNSEVRTYKATVATEATFSEGVPSLVASWAPFGPKYKTKNVTQLLIVRGEVHSIGAVERVRRVAYGSTNSIERKK